MDNYYDAGSTHSGLQVALNTFWVAGLFQSAWTGVPMSSFR